MIEYKASAVKEDFSNETRGVHSTGEKLSLTQLWEIISRTKRLPDGLDVNALYIGLRHKLRDPEREVRQHALRVLVDLIPVTQPQTLDDHMRDILPELISNLSNSAPAIRKNAIDSLRKYLQHSRDYDRLVVDLISSTEDDHIIAAIPYLIASETKDGTMAMILSQLWEDVKNPYVSKEVAAKSLATIGYSLGEDKFKAFIGAAKYNELRRICDSFGIVQHCPETYSSSDLWNKADDRVILETEITLRTGPAITMKIHEESGTNISDLNFFDNFRSDSSPILGVINILEEESYSDFDETVKRTPRKVRFGGESVKLRTPESDGSANESGGGVISITVTDAVSIETKRSLIPVRISSLPTTPKKVMYDDVIKRMHTSTPDLTSRSRFSKIPMKTNSNLTDKFRPSINNEVTEKQLTSPKKRRKPTELRTNKKNGANTAIHEENKKSRLSPSRATHNEIEVFHNLTRSPVRKSEPSLRGIEINNKHNDIDIEKSSSPSQNSRDIKNQEWQVVVYEPAQNPESSKSVIDKATEPVEDQESVEKNETTQKHEDEEELAYDSFQVFSNGTTEAKIEDSRVTKIENDFHFMEDNNNSFSVCPETSQYNNAGSIDRKINDISSGLWTSGENSLQHSLPVSYSKSEMALTHLIEGWRTEELEQCLWRLVPDICRARAPSGINMALMIMRRCSPKKLQDELLMRCFAHQLREGALQVLMAIARFLPSTEIEISRITRFAAASLKDRRKRVRQAALETLATVASLGSNAQVLEIVEEVTRFAPDHRYLMNVVRTRLSRRQLPTIEDDGTIRYSSPKDQTEYEWLLGEKIYSDSSPSSASSSHSVNYWTRNSRHVKDDLSEDLSNRDENANSNQAVWAVDPSVFHRNGYAKDNNKSGATVLQPVYILRPEPAGRLTARLGGSSGRGRSFSPAPAVRAAPLERMRKSLSSEQLGAKRGGSRAGEGGDRSSTSSTGSSTKSGVWQKEIKSGIPIPISSDTKLRFRSGNSTTNNASVGPVVARIRNLESPRDDKPSTAHLPLSSGSESSGYFTPPYGTNDEAFVKLEDAPAAIFRPVGAEEATESDTNNNSQEYANSCEDEADEAVEAPRGFSKPNTPDSLTIENVSTGNPNDEETLRIPALTSKEDLSRTSSPPSFVLSFPGPRTPSLSRKSSPTVENRRKSNSVVDLQNFLPEIPKRKNSAPVMKDEVSISRQFLTPNVTDIPSPDKVSPKPPEPESDPQEPEPPHRQAAPRRLSKRPSRTSSRRSTSRSTPRSVRSSTPSDPREQLQLALAQLGSPEWEAAVRGLEAVARTARQHPEAVEARVHQVCLQLGRHIGNLRSQVARAACATATEVFASCRKGLEVELEEVAGPLLHRTADTNRFLRADANAALDLMCRQLPPSRVVSIVAARGCNHQSGVVRSTGVRLLADLVKRMGAERVLHLQKECRDKVFLAGAKALVDGSLEARQHGKSLFSHLIGHQLFQRCLSEAVPQTTLRHVAKTLNSIKPVESNEC